MAKSAAATYEPEEIVLQKEEFSYGFILEVLTRGLYPNKQHALREYIQNSYDAILAWRKQSEKPRYGEITINFMKPSIVIYDNGTGMDWNKINQYRYVGFSKKKTGEGVGFRGIGKLAGISVAEKLIVTTSPAGIGERYQLVFDAEAMLAHIMTLKLKGENISLNELIKVHTSLDKYEEDPDAHFSMVELYNVRADSKILMNNEQTKDYLSTNVPVDFSPEFPYGQIIDGWLRDYVSDYDTVSIQLNGENIYKPYLSSIKSPQKGFVYETHEFSETDGAANEPLVFYWYSEHSEKGQFSDVEKRGLLYRVKNFAVGTNHLPRITLWKTSPHLAYYFWGEIHVCDPNIIPSSDRDNFEQNEARENLYRFGSQISRTLYSIANTSSAKRRAREFIERAEETVESIKTEARDRKIPKEVKFQKMFVVNDAIKNVDKRLKDATDEMKKRGERIVEIGEKLLVELEQDKYNDSIAIYDIGKTLSLGDEAMRIYELIIQCLEEELQNQPELYERLIRRIHDKLDEYKNLI